MRNRAAPVRKADYNENTFMSDYTLLEDTNRAIASAARTTQSLIPVPGRPNPNLMPGVSRGRMNTLVKEAAKRNINLHFMPRGFARHSRNSSFVRSIPEVSETESRTDCRDKAMFWHLDIYFESCSEKRPGTKLVKVDSCEEEQYISAVLKGAVDALRKGKKRTRSGMITCGRKENDGYTQYLGASEDDLVAFLRNEHVLTPNEQLEAISGPAGPLMRVDEFGINRYVQLETGQTLRESLTGRSVIEYPILHVAFKNSRQERELMTATCGIFEKPDESDKSESGSESESESEDDLDEGPNKKPDSPVHGASQTEADQSSVTVEDKGDELAVSNSEQEPPRKVLKLETSDAPAPVIPKERAQDASVISANFHHEFKPRHKFIAREEDKGNDVGSTVKSLETELRRNRHVSGSRDLGRKNEDASKKGSDSQNIGSPATESFATDTAERKAPGQSPGHSFMKGSVKAILETRIPRKRKTDGGIPCHTDLKKLESTKLATSNW